MLAKVTRLVVSLTKASQTFQSPHPSALPFMIMIIRRPCTSVLPRLRFRLDGAQCASYRWVRRLVVSIHLRIRASPNHKVTTAQCAASSRVAHAFKTSLRASIRWVHWIQRMALSQLTASWGNQKAIKPCIQGRTQICRSFVAFLRHNRSATRI